MTNSLGTNSSNHSLLQALEDVNLERNSRKETDPNLFLIQTFLENYAPALSYDGRQFYSQLLKCLNDSEGDSSNSSALRNALKKIVHQPPTPSLSSYADLVESSRKKNGTKWIEFTPKFLSHCKRYLPRSRIIFCRRRTVGQERETAC